jgi:hypothetical protein
MRFTRDGSFIFLTRFPKSGTEIDQTGAHDQTLGIDHSICLETVRGMTDAYYALISDE